MNSILDQIVRQTNEDLRRRRRELSERDLESMECYEADRRRFRQALAGDRLSIIAEVKRASPSGGLIRADFDPVKIAASYLEGGAAALSVLTDQPFFRGDLKYLESISKEVDIPLLRKDFIIDPYQVKEARAFGADAILLIASVTEGDQLRELFEAASECGLDVLVECYEEDEADQLDWEMVDLFGVNNRDLHTFEVDLHRGVEILRKSPGGVVRVSESGLSTSRDLKYLADNEIHAALIGEHFMRQPDPGAALRQMIENLNAEMEPGSGSF